MKVILHKLFPYAPYLNEYIGFEKEVGDSDEEALEAIKHLRELAERSHKEKYPNIYEENSPNTSPQPLSDPKETWVKQMIEEIEKCTSYDVKNGIGVQVGLLAYKSAADFDERIKASYDLKMLQLKQS